MPPGQAGPGGRLSDPQMPLHGADGHSRPLCSTDCVPGEPWFQLGCPRPSVGWASTPHGGRLHEPGPEPSTSGRITLCCSAQGSTPAPCSPGVSSTPSSSDMTATCAPGKHTPLEIPEDLYNNGCRGSADAPQSSPGASLILDPERPTLSTWTLHWKKRLWRTGL